MPDPDACLQAAAQLDVAAYRLAQALDTVTVGPTEWSGTTAERFLAELDHQRRQLAGVADAFRRQASLARTAATQLPPALLTAGLPDGRPDMRSHHAITWRSDRGSRDLLVTIHRPTASLADLAAAITASDGLPPIPPTSVTVDDVAHPGDLPAVAVLRRGAVLRAGTPSGRTCEPVAAVEVRALGGLAAGTTWRLPPGRHVVGRGPVSVAVDDRAISRRHAVVTMAATGAVSITDLASANGTRLDGRPLVPHRPTPWAPGAVAQLGGAALAIGEAAATSPPRPVGPVHRPPRQRDRRVAPSIHEPRPTPPPPVPPRFSWAGALVPLALGLVLAVVIDPRLAWFGLTGPVMVTASWLEERRRVRRAEADAAAGARADADRRAADLEAARLADVRWLQRARPDAAALVDRALSGSTAVWERRPDHDDADLVRVGVGPVPWQVPEAPPGASLDGAPVAVALGAGRIVGIVGDPGAARALARALVAQEVVLHGPADRVVVVLTDRPADWAWCAWLPHAAGHDGRPVELADLDEPSADGDPFASPVPLAGARDGRSHGIEGLGTFGPPPNPAPAARAGVPRALVVVDRVHPRPTLPAGSTALVVARSVEALPAACSVVVDVADDGSARLVEPATGRVCDDVAVDGVTVATADAVARALAGRTDPERGGAAGALPTDVGLPAVLDLGDLSAERVLARWRANPAGFPRATIGVTADGPLVLNLDRDGPHALVAGTTGAGKSELLRTLVAALACSAPPSHLAFVLVDFKGGSAFDACARLPHVAGVVTDLDERLAARALRSLDAELRERERRLRATGVADLAAYHHATGADDLPRLVVVVDEFATLAAEVPNFVDSLVDVAQRGRSLGVHLVLATQRPSGVVSPSIRANTNLRIALRVQDAADSAEVIDADDAARIARRCPGRGIVRLGPGERIAFQTARATTALRPRRAVTVRPLGCPGDSSAAGAVDPDVDGADADGPTALEGLVAAAVEAAARVGAPPVRRPWTDPLPDRLPWRSGHDGRPTMGGLDDPDHQARRGSLRWDPATGHLGVFGTVGAGAAPPALRTVAATLSAAAPPDRLHLYTIDGGAGGLAALASLPHVGAVVGTGERERLERLVARLTAEAARRRAGGAPTPVIVLLVDDLPGVLASVSDLRSAALHDAVRRLLADGPAVGIAVAFTASGPHALPLAVLGGVAHRWVLRLADPAEALALGLRVTDRAAWPVGRGDDAGSGLELQVAELTDADLAAVAAASHAAGAAGPAPIDVLPDLVPVTVVAPAADLTGSEWLVPVGIGGAALVPVGFRLGAGDHVLITGPARSGRTTALRAMARVVAGAATGPERPAGTRAAVELIAVCGRASALATDPAITRVVHSADVGALAAEMSAEEAEVADGGPAVLLLIDDADRVDDPTGALVALLRSPPPRVHVIAAAPADRVLGEFGHWTRELRRSRLGLALRPLADRDGEVWHTTLPRPATGALGPGRGYLVQPDGPELVQVATPSRDAVPTLRRSA